MVDLGYDIATALPELRTQAESMMVDACVIEYVSGSTWDEGAGTDTDTYSERYAGKCRVQAPVLEENRTEAGELTSTVQSLTVQLPMSATGFELDDRVTITASMFDPDLIGRIFVVTALAHKTHMTARRLRVKEITG